jgi:hypothetical protein
MQEALENTFPTVIANIIAEYVNVFKRPFKSSQCMVCEKRATFFNLCRDHHTLCLLCCDNTCRDVHDAEDDEVLNAYQICNRCEIRYGSSWIKLLENTYDGPDEDLYQVLYRLDDYPVDIEYFKQGMSILGMALEEGKKYNDDSKAAFEEWGGLTKARDTVEKLPDWFENTEIFSRWKEAERRIGSFTWSTVLKLIRKL